MSSEEALALILALVDETSNIQLVPSQSVVKWDSCTPIFTTYAMKYETTGTAPTVTPTVICDKKLILD